MSAETCFPKFSTAQSRRSFSPTSHRWTSQMRVTSIFPRPLLRPLAERSWRTKACTTPPRSMDLVPVAPACLDTWMMLPLDPMGLAALTALKQTTGDPSKYKRMKRDQKFLNCNLSWARGFGWQKAERCQEKLILGRFGAGSPSGWGEIAASTMSEGLNVFNTVAKCSAATPWHSSVWSLSPFYGGSLTFSAYFF